MAVRQRRQMSYGAAGAAFVNDAPLPIVAQRAPTTNDFAEVGTLWVDQPLDDTYILTSIVANAASWINAGGGTGTFNALTVTTTGAIGTALTVGTTLTVTGNTTLNTGLGVVQSSAAGVLTSSDGTDGQILISSTGAPAPAWAAITSATLVITPGAGTLNIEESGGTANSYVTDVAGPVVPLVGVLDVLGGTNCTTDGTVANTITIDLDDDVTLAGFLSVADDITMLGGDLVITADTNAAQTIYLQANGGVLETIDIYANQGTDLASIYVHSDDGGITIDAGIASADALNIVASNVAGGIDIDAGTTGVIVDTTGAISLDSAAASNYTVTGAFDLDLASTLGSVIADGGEAVADAVQLTASDAAGGITMAAGTGGITIGAVNGVVALTSGTAALNVGVDATAHVVTVGSVNTTSRTVIQSGSGDTAITSTDDITIDAATGLFSIDSTETSNITVTGASEDLQLYAVGGSVLVDGSEAAATAISMDASDGAGGVTIAAGTGGLLFGNQADCTTIDLGDFAPTAARTITVGGGTVITAAVTDTIDIGPDGATTNANSIKTVNINTGVVAVGEVLTNIASGDVTSGTHTVEIQTGVVTAGTVATNVSTGVGTKTVNFGNADGLTTVNIDAITLINDDINVATSINTGTSSGTVTIGNAAAGAMTIDTAAGISLDAATASNFTVTGAADLTLESTLGGVDITSALAAADAITLDASDAAGGVTTTCGSGGFLLDATGGTISLDSTVASNFTVTGANEDLTLSSVGGSVFVSSTESAADAILLQANGGAAETVRLLSSQGTGTGSVTLESTAGGITVSAALAAANAIIVDASDAAGGIDADCGTGGFNLAAANGPIAITSGTGQIDVSADATAATINIATGGGVKALTLGSINTTSSVLIQSGSGDVSVTSTDDITLGATGDLSLDGATVDINGTAGATSVTPGVGNVAGVALTLDARVFVATFTGQTTGAGADVDIDITNSFASAGIGVLITVSNQGTNDADILCEGVNTQTAGHIILHCINAGPAALNGNITVTGWIIN